MNATELMIKGLAQVTGIKPERDGNGMVNMTKFIEDYKKKYPMEFKERFGDASPDDVIGMFFSEMNN